MYWSQILEFIFAERVSSLILFENILSIKKFLDFIAPQQKWENIGKKIKIYWYSNLSLWLMISPISMSNMPAWSWMGSNSAKKKHSTRLKIRKQMFWPILLACQMIMPSLRKTHFIVLDKQDIRNSQPCFHGFWEVYKKEQGS